MLPFNLDTSIFRKKLVLFLVKRLIGNYINESISIDDIELNTNGFKIKHLNIESEILQIFSDFTDIKHNYIKDLEIYIPWSNLFSQSSELRIGKIFISMDWHHNEDININQLAQTILYKSLKIQEVENYLTKSIIEDKDFILSDSKKKSKKKNDEDGLTSLTTIINQFIENIKITIDVVEIEVNFPEIGQTISSELYGIEIRKTEPLEDDIETNESSDDEFKSNNSIERRINIDEITLFINKKSIFTIQDLKININSNITSNEYSKYYKELTIYTVNSSVGLIYAYMNPKILTMLLSVVKLLKNSFKPNPSVAPAKSYQLDINVCIETWKFILELNDTKNITSISKNIRFKFQNKPIWGVAKRDIVLYENNNILSKDFNFFPLEESMTPRQDSIISSIQSAISQQITTYEFSINHIEITEHNGENITTILKPGCDISKTNMIHMEHNGSLFEKVEIYIKPLLITLDITIINRYLPIIEAFDILKSDTAPKMNIFGQTRSIHFMCPLIQIIIKIPIGKYIMMSQKTDNNYLYEESLFVDIQELGLEYKSRSINITCHKILGNLLAQNQIINFFSAKSPKKEKPIVLQLFERHTYDTDDLTTLPEWFHVVHMPVGQQDVTVSRNVGDIDELNKSIMKKSKTIVKLNLRYVNFYFNETHYSVINNLLSELGGWESPFAPTQSVYMLSNIRMETLAFNLTHPNFKYTILGEMINVLNANNFYTKHTFTYFQIKDAYLYNNRTKKIILKKIDPRDPNFLRVGIQNHFPVPNIKEVTVAVEFSKVKMMSNHEEFSSHNKEQQFWLLDIMQFLNRESDVVSPIETKTNLFLNVKQLDISYKIWHIPSKIQINIDDISLLNYQIPHTNNIIYSVACNYLEIGLQTSKLYVPVVQNKFLNVLWKDKQIEIINQNCLIELCTDTCNVIMGIVAEFKKHNDIKNSLIIETDTEDETQNYDSVQLREIENMINDAIKSVSFDSIKQNKIGTMSIYSIQPKQSLCESYDKLSSIIYNSLVEGYNTYLIVKDLNIDIRLYNGLDLVRSRNHNIYMNLILNKINLIGFRSEDKKISKLFMTINKIGIKMINRETTTVLKGNPHYYFRSWNLIDESDMGLLNNIYSLNGGFDKKATRFLDLTNQFGIVLSSNNIDGVTEYSSLIDIQPINLNLGQEFINFITNYINFKDESLCTYYNMDGDYIQIDKFDIDVKEDKLYFRKFVINKLLMIINYKSSIFDLSWKKQSTILNFVNLEETKIELDEFNLNDSNKTTIQLNGQIKDYYLHQIKSNNSLNIITSLSPIRTIVRIGSGIVNLVIIPSNEGLRNNRWKYGIKKGFESFTSSTLSELANIGYKIVNTADKLINGKPENITITMPTKDYNARNIGDVISNFTKKTIRSGRNTMQNLRTELKDTDSEKKYREKMLSLQ